MKKFLLTLFISMLTVFSFASDIVQIIKYDNGNVKYELIAHPTVDGEVLEYNAYYKSGKIMMKGQYNEYGHRSGSWTSYYESGQMESYTFFSNGDVHGNSWYYNEDGSVFANTTHKYGKRHGLWMQYNEEGKLISQREYKKGKRHGVWQEYSTDGEMLVNNEEYKNGKLIEGWYWSENKGLIARYP